MILVRACACVCAVHVDEDTLTVPEDGVRVHCRENYLHVLTQVCACMYVCV